MTEQLHPVYASDVSVPLISLIQAVRNGWKPPDSVSEAEYAYARTLPETHPAHGFCGFGCSFGGKLWGGYARGDVGRNYAQGSRNTLLRQIAHTRSTYFCEPCDYLQWTGASRTAFYCDPPYANTTKYTRAFDSLRFWEWCSQQTRLGALMLVSEFAAPAGVAESIVCVQSKSDLHTKHRAQATCEHLFKVR